MRNSAFGWIKCYEFGTESLAGVLLGAKRATLPGMKRFLRLAIVLSIAITVLGAGSKANDGVALFRVTRVESTIVMSNDSTRSPRETLPDVSLVPMAVIEGGRWMAPVSSGRCTDNKWDDFEKNYLYGVFAYHMGTQRGPLGINVLRGEKKAAAILASMRMPLLSSFQERAIAANSDKLGREKTNQKAANKEETVEFLNVARKILSVDIKAPEAELAKLRVERPIVTDFGTGKNVMIGTAVSTQDTTHHALFLVIEQGATGWKPILADYQHSDPKKGYLASLKFVDQLDVDGDGVDEIFADIAGEFGYRAYGFRDGRWRVIYEDKRDANGCVQQVK